MNTKGMPHGSDKTSTSLSRSILWTVGIAIALLSVMAPPRCQAYPCSEPQLFGEVSAIAPDGTFVLKITTTMPNKRFNLYWRGGMTYILYPGEPSYHTLSTLCMTGPSELRAVPLNCYNDEYLPGAFSTTIAPPANSTQPAVAITVTPPDDSGVVSVAINYDFPNTNSPGQRELWYTIEANGSTTTSPTTHPENRTGTLQFTYNVACAPPNRVTFTAFAKKCDVTAQSSASVTPSHTPQISVRSDLADANRIYVTYAFPQTSSPSQRTVRIERADGSVISEQHPAAIRGEESFTLSACEPAGGLKAVAIACGDQRTERPVEPARRKPRVKLSLRKGPIDSQTHRRKIIGHVEYDMREGTSGWRLYADLLRWVSADGREHQGLLLWQRNPVALRAGVEEFTIIPPDGAQQIRVRATAESCAGISTDDAAIEVKCEEDSSGNRTDSSRNPVLFSDGNVQLTDTDALPRIGGRALSRAYNSDEQVVALFGRGWTTLFDQRLMLDTLPAGETVSIVTESNEVITFVKTGGGYAQTWPSARRAAGSLKRDTAAGTFTYRGPGSSRALVFNAGDGRLLLMRDVASGREARISYSPQGLPQTLTDSWSGVSWNLAIDVTRRVVTSIGVSSRPDLTWSYTYDADGNLTNVLAPGGNTWRTYEYAAGRMTASRDALGNLIESHTYDADGFAITSTGDSDEIASIQYGIATGTADERITRVTESNGAVTDYVMRPAGGAFRPVRINGGCASCGTRDRTYVRDDLGRVIRDQSPDGYITTVTYVDGLRISEGQYLKPVGCDPQTDANHCRLDTDTLATAALETTVASTAITYAYDDPNWPERITATTTPSVTASDKSRVQIVFYHPTSGAVTRVESHGWSAAGAPVEHVTTTAFYADQDPSGAGANGTAAFDPGGSFSAAWLTLPQPPLLPRSTDGPRSDVDDRTLFVYYPIDTAVPAALRGRLAAVRNAAGHITRYEAYDVFGNATRLVDPNNVATETTYDALGRVLTSTVKGISGCNTAQDALCAVDVTTIRAYSPPAGPLQSEQRPGGGVTLYVYDARGRVRTTSRGSSATDLREQIESSYDPATGMKSLERILAFESGAWVEKKRDSFTYDDRRQLRTVTHADSSTVNYTYDAAGRVASVRDENHAGANTLYGYDPAGRLATVQRALAEAPNGVVTTRQGYDNDGELVSVIDPNGNETRYVYDDYRRLLAQHSPVSGTTQYGYDEAGNLKSTIDANNARTDRTYDALNRMIASLSVRGTAAEAVSWAYDDPAAGRFAIGRLSSTTDPAGTATYDYERRGLLRKESRSFVCPPPGQSNQPCDPASPHTYAMAFGYDRDGNRSSITYASDELTVIYGFDYAGRPVSASGVVTSAQYLPFGPLKQVAFSNGTTQTLAFDLRYRPTQNTLTSAAGTLAQYQYEYDPAGNIRTIKDLQDTAYDRAFTYDDLNRLTGATTGAALWRSATYTWDAMGNILSTKLAEIAPGDDDGLIRFAPKTDAQWQPAGRTITFGYAGTTARLAAVTANDLEHSVTLDAAGNETGYLATRIYSPRNLLSDVIEGDPEDLQPPRVTYTYDGSGVRVVTSDFAGRRYHLYSPELRLLTMANDTATQYHIVWFGDRPVAQVPAGGGRLYTFADHLGTPVLQTDAAANVVWRAELEPFGNVFDMRIGSRGDQPLRLPGQEAALVWQGTDENYNIFRWYNTAWGRYTQADPVGLQAGTNLFAYVHGNPIKIIDPFGLKAELVCKNVGTAGIAIPLSRHCRLRVTCDTCAGPPPEIDVTVGMEFTGNPPYTINEWPYPSGLQGYTETWPVAIDGKECDFTKCVRAYNKLFSTGFTGQATQYVPAYSVLGPNSNTYAARLIEICGGLGALPPGAIGAPGAFGSSGQPPGMP